MKGLVSKNSFIEFVRFISCLMIMGTHSYMIGVPTDAWSPFRGGYLSVELFLALTGYFTVSHIEKNQIDISGHEMEASVHYTFRKIGRIFPYTTIGIIANYCIIAYADPTDRVSIFTFMPFEVLLLGTSGLSFYNYLQPLWYVSALIFILPVFYYFATRFHDVFSGYLAILGVPLLYGYIFKSVGTIHFAPALLRATSGLLNGALVYYAAEILYKSRKEHNRLFRIFITVIELMLLIEVIHLQYKQYDGWYDFFAVLIIDAMLILSFSGITYTCRIRSKAFDNLGWVSLPIYVFSPVIAWFIKPVEWSLRTKAIIWVIVSFVVSEISVIFIEAVKRYINGRFSQ